VKLGEWQMWWKRRGATGIRNLLMKEWDPIGVRGIPEAADEYDSSAGSIGRMLREGRTVDELAAHLTYISTERMGLADTTHTRDKDKSVAEQIARWYRAETAGGE
jgi:hypothetical protein